MRTQRITIEEVYVVARKQGIEELKNVDVIILETTGDITIIQHIQNQQPRTLEILSYLSGEHGKRFGE